jgi:leucine dehydrogenase
VLVQGLGAVGEPLSRRLSAEGATLVVTDVDEVHAKELAAELAAEVVAPDEAIGVECDVFSPCATGGVLSAETIPRLRCRVVAGAANNQLAAPEDAERFAAREILYAPDYVVNAGGIIHLASLEMLGEDLRRRDERVDAIGDTLAHVFRIAEAEGISTGAAADRLAHDRIEGGNA